MGFFFPRFSCRFSRKNYRMILAFSWIAAFLCGVFTSSYTADFLTPLLWSAASSPGSLFGSLICSLLPLLFSGIAAAVSWHWLIVPINFATAFFQGYFGSCILLAFGDAGWLIRFLLFFSNFVMMPVLWLFWIQATSGNLRKVASVYLLTGILVGCVDFSFVSPFLVEILSL